MWDEGGGVWGKRGGVWGKGGGVGANWKVGGACVLWGAISVVLADRGVKFGVQSDDSDDVMRA